MLRNLASVLTVTLLSPIAGGLVIAPLMATPVLAGATETVLSGPAANTRFGESAAFSASVFGDGPTGTVSFLEGSAVLASVAVKISDIAVTPVEAGRYHSCAVTAAGTVQCWGRNSVGQLGDGTTTNSMTAVEVAGLDDVSAIAVGFIHTCALTNAGAVKCWGSGTAGQLGNGSNVDSLAPVQVSGLASGVVALVSGDYHICALTGAGGVKCWGTNSFGQLGDNSTTDSETPVNVDGLTSGVAAISSKRDHTCALTEAGAAMCWGYGTKGQLGNNTTLSSSTPVGVFGLSSGVAAIAAGGQHTCALVGDAAKCWGNNNLGQVGDGTNSNISHPADVTGLSSGVVAMAAGDAHSCALLDGGGMKCWGYNNWGQLGDGTETNANTPVDVTGLAGTIRTLGLGLYHTCVSMDDGSADCWGDNQYGKLGDGTDTDRSTPVDVAGVTAAISTSRAFAEFSTGSLDIGGNTIAARYNGDADNTTSLSPGVTQVVDQGETRVRKIKLTPRKPKIGKSVRIKVEMEAEAPAVGTPGGKVVIKDGRKKLGKFDVNSKGKASIKVKILKSGKHTIKAKYKGDTNWKKSDDTKKVTVKD